MPSKWLIRFWPECEFDVFLSHCREDRESLIRPVFDELTRRNLIPWADWHHYPIAHGGYEAMREGLLRCRHVAYFLTPAAVRQGRGWMAAERVLAATIQEHFSGTGTDWAHVELPLLLMPQNDSDFQQSTWRGLINKARVCHPVPEAGALSHRGLRHDDGRRDWNPYQVLWAANEIERFIEQERKWGLANAMILDQDSRFKAGFPDDENFLRRLKSESPLPPSSEPKITP